MATTTKSKTKKKTAQKKKKPPNKKTIKKGKTKGKSSSAGYPRHSISTALRIPKAILDQNAGKACTEKEAANFEGITASGPFKLEVSSSIKFGLLNRPVAGKIQPSDLAKKILRPKNDTDELQGYREAIQQAPTISEVYKHYRGENLPEPKFFKNTVIGNYNVPADKFEEFQQVFIESLDTARLLSKHGENFRVIDITEEDKIKDVKSIRIEKLGKSVKIGSGEKCFVMQPFAPPLGDYFEKVFKPAIEKAGFTAVRADADIFGAGKIMDQVWRGINEAKVIVVELTSRNPNVFYELGLAHALEKPAVLVSSNEDDVPFDLKHIRVIYYDTNDPFWGTKLIEKVAENILSAIKNPEEAIFKTTEPH